MKKLGWIYLFMALSVNYAFSQTFNIKGKVDGARPQWRVLLEYFDGNKYITDSVEIVKGNFHFTGKINMPVKAQMYLMKPEVTMADIHKGASAAARYFFIDPVEIAFSAGFNSFEKAMIKGGRSQKEFKIWEDAVRFVRESCAAVTDSALKYYRMNDLAKLASFEKKRDECWKKIHKISDSFIVKNPGSYVSLSLLQDRAVVMEPETFLPLYNKLAPALRNNQAGQQMASKLEIAMKTAIGKKAIDFTQQDSVGKAVSLSDFSGKYVLIEFWASWCKPCRAENPQLLSVYKKHKNDLFEIIGITLDTKRQSWLKAIAEDELPWVHVYYAEGGRNPVANEYGINAIPQNVLVDPSGVIIAKNLSSEELDKKLGELLF